MRIRKNAKLSPLLFSHGGSVPLDTFQTHVCQLNQSPWDVIPFGSDYFQFEGEDSFPGNGSPGDSIGAVESVASMMDAEEKPLLKIEDIVVNDNDDTNEAKVLDNIGERRIAFDKAKENTSCCQKTDGKNWHCKNEAKQGQSFCDHHLSLLRSYNSGSYSNTPKKMAAAAAAASAAGARRAKARAAKKAAGSSSASNPYEFYYYSGFGPLWGKRRGDRSGEGNKNNELKGGENSTITEATEAVENDTQNANTSPSSSSTQNIDDEEFDYEVDDDDDDDDDDEEEDEANGDSGKKRMRKPVKARSLKSLM